MQITRTRTRYYLLSVLGALAVAVGVLAVAPSAQAQNGPVTVDKACTPNPVQIGQDLTCTIDVEAAPGTQAIVQVSDVFEAGVRPTEATLQQVVNGVVVGTFRCGVSGNIINCPFALVIADVPQGNAFLRLTIDATAEQCGTFTNTAEAERFFPLPASTFTGTEEITVEGCEEEAGRGGGAAGGGGAIPITQEGEQESDAGEIDQSFEVS